MRAALGDPAVVHDKDLIGVPDGCQPVRDGDDGLAACQLGNGLLDRFACKQTFTVILIMVKNIADQRVDQTMQYAKRQM